MYKKILNVLTAVSALAVAGLLSIIPASVAHASVPSQPVSQTPETFEFSETIQVLDYTGLGIEPTLEISASPVSVSNKTASFNISFSGMRDDGREWRNFYFESRFRIFSSDTQMIMMRAYVPYESFNYESSATGSFNFEYNNNNYSGNIRLYPMSSVEALGGEGTDNYITFDPISTETPDVDIDMPPASPDTDNVDETPSTDAPSTSDTVDPVDTEVSDDDVFPEFPEIPGDTEVPSGHVGGGEVPDDKAFYEEIEKKVKEIALASQGLSADGSPNPSRVVNYNTTGAISSKIIKALMNSEGVTLIYTFEYEGIIFRSVITSESARAMYSETIDWYGPCYVAIFCPPVPIGFVK